MISLGSRWRNEQPNLPVTCQVIPRCNPVDPAKVNICSQILGTSFYYTRRRPTERGFSAFGNPGPLISISRKVGVMFDASNSPAANLLFLFFSSTAVFNSGPVVITELWLAPRAQTHARARTQRENWRVRKRERESGNTLADVHEHENL